MTDTIQIGRLAELETVIERGQQTFVEVGIALLEIRDGRLYRESHATFEDYCRERWGWSRGRGDQLAQAAEVVAVLPTAVGINERQARELVPLKDEPEAMRDVWAGVIERAEQQDQQVTGPVIRKAVRDYIKAKAEGAEQELQTATAWMSTEQREVLHPEQVRQRGELIRLIGDLNRLPDARAYALTHRAHLSDKFFAEAMYASGWLETFCDALEERDGN